MATTEPLRDLGDELGVRVQEAAAKFVDLRLRQ